MPRPLPWALVGLLSVAAGVGATLGAVAAPASSRPSLVAQIIAATRNAGSARFTYTRVAVSSNPLLASSTTGQGQVDFAHDSISSSEEDRDTELVGNGTVPQHVQAHTSSTDQIWIGNTLYEHSGSLPVPGWTRFAFPVGSSGPLGQLRTVDPVAALVEAESVAGARLTDMGGAELKGIAVTAYRLTARACSDPASRLSIDAFTVWIDSSDRLVQARETETEVLVPSAFPRRLATSAAETLSRLGGRSVTTSTIRLFAFGQPVRVTAPTTIFEPNGGGGSRSVVWIRGRSDRLG